MADRNRSCITITRTPFSPLNAHSENADFTVLVSAGNIFNLPLQAHLLMSRMISIISRPLSIRAYSVLTGKVDASTLRG